MGSLQEALSKVSTPPASPPVPTEQKKLEPKGEPSSLAESLEAVCKDITDRLQPFITQLDRVPNGGLRDMKQAVKMLHERAVNARRVAAAARQ